MALAASTAGADRIFLMGYDYHWSGSGPGASSPIDRRDGDEKDLVWSLDMYAALGVPVERTILGLPLYGMAWPVVGPELGAPQTGKGTNWIPSDHLDFLGDPANMPTLDEIEQVDQYVVATRSVRRQRERRPRSERIAARHGDLRRFAGDADPQAGDGRRARPGRRRLLGDRLRPRPARLRGADQAVPRGQARVGRGRQRARHRDREFSGPATRPANPSRPPRRTRHDGAGTGRGDGPGCPSGPAGGRSPRPGRAACRAAP